jgi:predicted neutral ceramidase superfamily lipid hydrolase
MKKIIASTISVFLLLGNAMSMEGYKPPEFWGNKEEIKDILTKTSHEAIKEMDEAPIVFCSSYGVD